VVRDTLAPMRTSSCSLLVAGLLWGLSCSGTTIIVMRAPDGILFAADGKAVQNGSNLPPQCKIHQYGKVFAAIASVTTSERVGVDTQQAVRAAAATSGPLLAKVESFTAAARKYLPADIEYQKQSNRASYERDYLKKSILEVTFAPMSGPNPEAVVQTFVMDGAGVLHEQRSPLGSHRVLVTGMTSAIKSYTEQNSGWYNQLGPDGAIKKFMELEMALKQNAARSPVSVLKMDVDGVRWVEQGACPAIRK